MPEPFQPKFVDLVRNFTTTQGTGNFVLGAAVAGHSSLASAVAIGERFYYCAMGVDKPAEREVGRGTKLANGTVAREPINGPLTNFSNGTKTISLVVAAEWFDDAAESINGGVGGGITGGLSLTFATAAGAAIGATITGVETIGHATAGIGGARYVHDAAVDAAFVTAHPTWSFLAADGRGFRLYEDVLQLEYFGAVPGDYASGVSADCLPAWNAAMQYLDMHPRNISSAFYEGAREIFFPGAQYYFSDTLNLKRTCRLTGMGTGLPAGDPTLLRWPAGKIGIIVNRYNTLGLAAESPATTGGDGSLIRGFKLKGGYTAAEGNFHGIQLRGRAAIEDVVIEGFEGDGIHIAATGGGSPEGNANNWSVSRARIVNCRDGVFVDGADVNAGMGLAIDVSGNRRWGIWDSSFLGNTWVGCHSDSNGLVPGATPSVVSHGGNRYCVKVDQEAGAATNAPSGTTADSADWYYIGAGGVNAPNNISAWVSGTAYRAGGAYRSDGVNAQTLFLGCYSEGGQGFAQGASPTLSIGGQQGAPWRGPGVQVPVHVSNYLGVLASSTAIGAINPLTGNGLVIGNDRLEFRHATNGTYTFEWFNGDLAYTIFRSGTASSWAFKLTGEATASPLGSRKLDFPNGYGLAGKKILSGTAAPTSGTYAQGDMVWNSAPAAGGVPGWMCVAAGTPGTWKAMANLAV